MSGRSRGCVGAESREIFRYDARYETDLLSAPGFYDRLMLLDLPPYPGSVLAWPDPQTNSSCFRLVSPC